jgi:dTMP kinase
MHGLLVAFEGLDQSGKQTQAERLRDRLTGRRRDVTMFSFPDYETAIGAELGHALAGERSYEPEAMQLLYVANRYEWKQRMLDARAGGTILLCDRYLASSVAYGEAQGLDAAWLVEIQKYLPQPDLTILLDISPDESARRKRVGRDTYERDLGLLARVRESYLRQAVSGWVRIDAERPQGAVTADVFAAVDRTL